ncbi:class I glutamine amidotransferase-like protein [Punctularia strigosozonata HHB-11173 SS5]|uniref:class I glutamine amidotransferase-like protein n=1 Tax=Punctularia strigosozonata (strain HHB-11173) TaxID=741275 RepID=UPI0004416C50|nr:class I glutamine amidotransferase-like protein [Punctularia strigosozonata HHB-11173 SS5]EIN06054.1 class I glutamine amidotransferase-like protein [Punctularia strigosozonata HHB-11173 SS5]
MADYGHDPTETAVPFETFLDAGYDITFATETGTSPRCDQRMLEGWTQKLLGAKASTIAAYNAMLTHPSLLQPLGWTEPSFSLEPYNLVFLPGGHDSGVRQVIDSEVVHKHIVSYFPHCLKSAANAKAIAAVCHGVMVLSESSYPAEYPDAEKAGKSVAYDLATTALPHTFEQGIWHATRPVLGDYYKTYGAGSPSVEQAVKAKLRDPKTQWKGGIDPLCANIVEDDAYNYISARFPGDVPEMVKAVLKMMDRVLEEKAT